MGAWGFGILESDTSMDWFDRWTDKFKSFKKPEVVSLIENDLETYDTNLLDKAWGYMVLGTIILANNLPISGKLKGKILKATVYEKNKVDWMEPEEREKVLVDFREKISLLNNT